jgi:hypothetical protein
MAIDSRQRLDVAAPEPKRSERGLCPRHSRGVASEGGVSPPPMETGPALASMLIYVLMAGVLAFRPEGLFPARTG